ncbi:hypothetical protein HY486_02885 [Candidatus Woesearchaeota archaeon]|nr:hypothetical protein [Candidatus Woesearchaeota archaeon]
MKKLILLAILLLTACATDTGVITQDVRTGTQGIQSKFAIYPTTVSPGERIAYTIEIRNEGASDGEGTYTFTIDESAVSLLPQTTNKITLKGKDIFNQIGQKEYLTFKAKTKELPPRKQSAQAQARFSTCYDYTTQATADVCIDTRPDQYPKACIPQVNTFLAGQGAPVAVQTIETRLIPMDKEHYFEPQFVITATNAGTGIVLAKGTRNPCTGQPTKREDYGIIGISAEMAGQQLICTPLKIETGKATCRLIKGIKEQATYQSSITVKLEYGYFESIIQQLTIEK